MAVLLDLSAIIAAADTADLNHAAARTWFGSVDVPLLVGALTLAGLYRAVAQGPPLRLAA